MVPFEIWIPDKSKTPSILGANGPITGVPESRLATRQQPDRVSLKNRPTHRKRSGACGNLRNAESVVARTTFRDSDLYLARPELRCSRTSPECG
jgi:hypothetical protein